MRLRCSAALLCWPLILAPRTLAADPPAPAPAVAFDDVAARAGVVFRFHDGTRGRHDLPEIMGGGVALLDVDGDGWLDIFLCNGGPIGPAPHAADPPCRLYRNNRDGTFADVTEQARAPGPSYAMGAAVGDFDGDGRDDLFVTGWRDQRLYRNNGDGTFADVTERAGVASSLWSTSAAFADLDGDGDLDLYVAAYVRYDADHPTYCAAPDGQRDYCGPEEFAAEPDRLFRNNGDGTFTDVSGQAGVALPGGRGLGVLVADLTGDGQPDIFVANDGTPCWLFANRGGLRFDEIGAAAGVALDGRGSPLAGMGVALGDVDGDAQADLVVTNFHDRSTVAFQALGAARYRDASAALGLTAATRKLLGFGVTLTDLDADGRPDLLQANGHVLDRARLGVPFAMKPLALRNEGGRLVDVSAAAGPWFSRPILGRGLAIGDLDHDGRPDVVVNALDASAAVLRNTSRAGHALALDLVPRPPHRSPVGATVRARIGGRIQVHQVPGGGSYLSAPARTVFLGLGEATRVDRLEITWPSGRVSRWQNLPAGRTTLHEPE